MRVYIPVSAGDLIDRITILKIKKAKIPDRKKLANIDTELDSLLAIRACFPKLAGQDVKAKERALQKENRALWAIEDKLRALEAKQAFGEAFVNAARSVYRTNDRRAELKREIDALVGSVLREEKWFSAK